MHEKISFNVSDNINILDAWDFSKIYAKHETRNSINNKPNFRVNNKIAIPHLSIYNKNQRALSLVDKAWTKTFAKTARYQPC